ncbi:hypothetical protein RBG61_11860 [Paludicola sp. MB14-C6]|uniref:hypothetical protein n=1 Tax=Paludihabitans sp. MB14-C6 TaxID=3070656 RepID=UPI0027DBB9B8|nr:hypothetical protein [Paludicola sp. MB14-C6]WMJ22678.1 hypothetical protein RBG61_11860 [Paludicola sp. MB14-C6]
MCDKCNNIILYEFFHSPKEYLKCLDEIGELVRSEEFDLIENESTCRLEQVRTPDGYWADDIICHIIRCNNCNQVFSCSCNTYRGGGGFHKGRK